MEFLPLHLTVFRDTIANAVPNNRKINALIPRVAGLSQPATLKNTGFSLLELLAVTALIAIFLTWGVYGYRELFQNRTDKEEPRKFINALKFARSYALTSGRVIFVCPGESQARCLSRDYAQGWVVLEVLDPGYFATPPPNARLVNVGMPLLSGFSIKTNAFSDFVRFSEQGRAHTNGHFFFCRTGTRKALSGIVIIRSGRLRSSRESELSDCEA